MRIFTQAITLLTFLFFSVGAFAQTVVSGMVTDAATGQPLTAASVYFKGNRGVTTDKDGHFTIGTTNLQYTTLMVSYVGYKTASQTVESGKRQEINITLFIADDATAVVVTNKKRAKYSNKNNPAVDFIRQVIDHKAENRSSVYDHLQYEEYDKTELALTKTPEKLANSRLFRNYKFLVENRDTTKLEGKAIIPVYMKEKIAQKYIQQNPDKNKTIVLADRQVDFGEYVDNVGIQTYLNRLYERIDVYDNNISLLTNTFLSPLAESSPSFYRFYLGDTLEVEGVKVLKVNFSARNLRLRRIRRNI